VKHLLNAGFTPVMCLDYGAICTGGGYRALRHKSANHSWCLVPRIWHPSQRWSFQGDRICV